MLYPLILAAALHPREMAAEVVPVTIRPVGVGMAGGVPVVVTLSGVMPRLLPLLSTARTR